jgi:hypothetical protein
MLALLALVWDVLELVDSPCSMLATALLGFPLWFAPCFVYLFNHEVISVYLRAIHLPVH